MDKKNIRVFVTILLLVGLFGFFFFMRYSGELKSTNEDGGLPPGIIMIVVMLLIVGVGAYMRSKQSGASGMSNARRILDERYARGEISDTEYRTKVDDLKR